MKSTIQRRFALLIGAALAISAFAAPSAFAVTQVKSAATGQLCPETNPPAPVTEQEKNDWVQTPKPYVSGGCTVYQRQMTDTYLAGWYGWERAQVSFKIHVGPSGWGLIDNASVTWSSTNLLRVDPDKKTWSLAPVDYKPAWASFFFPEANAQTDFNSAWSLISGTYKFKAYPSFDVTQGNPLQMKNQTTGLGEMSRIKLGTWDGTVAGNPGIIVTH